MVLTRIGIESYAGFSSVFSLYILLDLAGCQDDVHKDIAEHYLETRPAEEEVYRKDEISAYT